jgi:hypothetical protein
MLLDEDPKPCKSDPMRNKPEFIKNVFGFIECWKELCEEDITKCIMDTHEPSIVYLDGLCLALMTLAVNTHTTLIQGFRPQSQLTVVESNAIFFNNGDVHEEFTMDEH